MQPTGKDNPSAVNQERRQLRALPWAAARLIALLCLLLPGAALTAVEITWPEALYNPQPLPDDVVLPMPCGGAMVFRWVQANGRVPAQSSPQVAALYRLVGPFARHGSRYLLIGKYEVTQLQYQAVQAQAAGMDCPVPAALGLQVQGRVGWHDATGFATDWSHWLLQNTEQIPDCATGASPCLPQQDGVPAFLRLPREAEWEYAARGGLAVTPAQFAEPIYPMPEGLARHA